MTQLQCKKNKELPNVTIYFLLMLALSSQCKIDFMEFFNKVQNSKIVYFKISFIISNSVKPPKNENISNDSTISKHDVIQSQTQNSTFQCFFGTKCRKDLFTSVEYLREKKSFDYIFQLLFFHILKCKELKLEKQIMQVQYSQETSLLYM